MKKLLVLLLLLTSLSVGAETPDSLTFAVLGNSISTYYDYLPAGYAVYYTADREKNEGIQVGDQWWMQLSRLSGLTFLANASWSGSRVAFDNSTLGKNSPFCCNHRVNALGRAGVPDFIFIAGGTNDWAHDVKVPLGEYRTENFKDSLSFRGAYQRLLWKLTTWYPETKVVCLSILPRGESANQKNAAGWSQADGNASIKHIAEQFGQYYIDCTTIPFSSNWGRYMLPGNLHPSADGFTLMAQHIYNKMISGGIITRDLKRSGEVEEAERLLDISFTEEGIVNNGTYNLRVGKHGSATTYYDAANDTYYGCSKAKSSDYFYATYDEDTPLAEAFRTGNVTWEMLVRLDGLADHNGNISRTCILGNEEGSGGWAFYNSDLASCFSYGNMSGVKSTIKSITGDSILVSGRFYHLVVTMDRLSHIMRYFINGKLVCTGTRAGTDMKMPLCGSVKGRKGMWICLGGDATSGSFSSGAENASACSFVFARVYDGALTQKSALALYDDYVKKFTEPQPPFDSELLLDCKFTPEGAVNHAPSYRDIPIVMMGEVPTCYNPDINLYEAQFNKTRTQFFKYNIAGDPSILKQMSDAYSVEVFCRNSNALPASNTRPLGFLNGFGFGLQMSNRGNIGYTSTTQGNKADGSYAKTQWSWIGDGTLTDAYTHYLIVYDRLNYRSQLFINGQLADTRWLTFKECPVYEWTPSTWLAIGGDAYGNYATASQTGSYAFMGDVALVRIYNGALNQSQASTLADILNTQEKSFSIGANGYAAICLPYYWQVPEGCTAFIASEIVTPSLMLRPFAQAGELVPYGTPVILKGQPKQTVTLTAIAIEHSAMPENATTDNGQSPTVKNLLVGTYPGRNLSANEGNYYYLKSTGTNDYLYRASTNVALPPFSCYLPSSEKKTFLKLEEEDATGIASTFSESEIANSKSLNGKCYDLSGREVKNGKQKKGIYIQANRKVLIP